MRLLVINNKSSGLGDSAIYDFLRIIGEAGDELVVRNVSPDKSTSELVADAESFDVVVAAGGDGTVASVCYELRYRKVPVVPFPAGTGNLLSMNLSSPEEPRAIADMVRKRNIETYDLGELEYTNESGTHCRHGFAIMAGAGYDAMIMDSATGLKGILGQNAYYVSALITEKPTKAKITLIVDGKKYNTSGIGVVLVNFGKIAPDISVTHVNDAQDGLLEVVVLKADNKLMLIPALVAAILDKRGQFPTRTGVLEIYAGREVEVITNPVLPIQFDGEMAHAHTPLKAKALPGALDAIVDDEELVRLETLRLLDGSRQ